jgi:hypothetical protein
MADKLAGLFHVFQQKILIVSRETHNFVKTVENQAG